MSELKLVGLHEDGEHVVLEGPDGQRFHLPIDEALRAAVRRDRPQLEQVRVEQSGTLPPREIQARIRSGLTAAEVAESVGMAVEQVRRYEGPVLAEREFIAAQARATRIGREASAPVLGDLVTDRLATRGVDLSTLAWDAFRPPSAPWTVQVSFTVSGPTAAERSARWVYDAGTRSVRAVDDEARWLSETELADEPIPRRHLAAVRSSVFDVEVDDALRPLLTAVDLPSSPEPEPDDSTHALLDDLSDRRGFRQALDEHDDDHEEFEGFGPQHAFDFDNPELAVGPVPAAHPPHSRPQDAVDATVLPMPPSGQRAAVEATTAAAQDAGTPDADTGARASTGTEDSGETADPPAPSPPARSRGSRKGRASVPSWDEIVFGAKPE
ncbi:septation protein SepH [Actinotalea sp. K2]|uniref:septation protein SepH n=1 Tax=Actinotalea sp. K2 TaxID=2939438 RepID=UPI002016B669|nr:septation protein SepH [Actinotalea sp. K2]MCL3862194.1 septation protein SepH [Actinotalea sp. K2]